MVRYFKDIKRPHWNLILKRGEDGQYYIWAIYYQEWISCPDPPEEVIKEITEEEAFIELLCMDCPESI